MNQEITLSVAERLALQHGMRVRDELRAQAQKIEADLQAVVRASVEAAGLDFDKFNWSLPDDTFTKLKGVAIETPEG